MWLATRTRPDLSCSWHLSTLSPEKVDCLLDLREASHGSKIASRIRQDGQSTKKELETPEIPCFHIHSFTDAGFATSQQIRIYDLFGSSRNGQLFGAAVVLEKANHYCTFCTRGRDSGHV